MKRDEKQSSEFATGRELYERLARSGPPHEVTLRGLPRRKQKRLPIAEALAARPEGADDPTHRYRRPKI
ncbi:hypothetical protein ACRARE_21405 [Pseudooceanicola sp. 200-1SW]